MALIDDFKARFAEFSAATVDAYFGVVGEVWPAYYSHPYRADTREAILNLIAHLLVEETRASKDARHVMRSKSVGGVSVSYDTPTNAGQLASMFGSTKYGQRFHLLSRRHYGPRAV